MIATSARDDILPKKVHSYNLKLQCQCLGNPVLGNHFIACMQYSLFWQLRQAKKPNWKTRLSLSPLRIALASTDIIQLDSRSESNLNLFLWATRMLHCSSTAHARRSRAARRVAFASCSTILSSIPNRPPSFLFVIHEISAPGSSCLVRLWLSIDS